MLLIIDGQDVIQLEPLHTDSSPDSDLQTSVFLIFPSWLPHLTEQNHSDSDRIMVSFNIDLDKN